MPKMHLMITIEDENLNKKQKKMFFLLCFDYFHYFCTVFIMYDNSTKTLKWRK
jgi:hypothetical protein